NHAAGPVQSRAAPARETLTGDRLCMKCLHPLAGRTIERDPATELLFVRCGECGAASALFEYPTVAPWLSRIKLVAASTLAVVMLLAAAALAGISGGLTAMAAGLATEEAAARLLAVYGESNPPLDEVQRGYWTACDEAWMVSEEGRQAVERTRWHARPVLPFMLVCSIGCVLLTPCAMLIGTALMRHSALRRGMIALVPCAVGLAIAIPALALESGIAAPTGMERSWSRAAHHEFLMPYAFTAAASMCAVTVMMAAVGPLIVASIARVILPPSDRRLVAWLWEWRGKPIPR
ncbi:MAG: hypothetical protein RLZZ238_112, partial [Planctomycetota bacterium]